jgi:hypothetical protein
LLFFICREMPTNEKKPLEHFHWSMGLVAIIDVRVLPIQENWRRMIS